MNPQIAASSHGIIKIIFEPTVSEKAFTTPLVRRVGKKKKTNSLERCSRKKKDSTKIVVYSSKRIFRRSWMHISIIFGIQTQGHKSSRSFKALKKSQAPLWVVRNFEWLLDRSHYRSTREKNWILGSNPLN